jgi:hypothetical protein
MGLIDWLRGERGGSRDTQAERTETATAEEATAPAMPETLDQRVEEEHDEEAVRHRGM